MMSWLTDLNIPGVDVAAGTVVLPLWVASAVTGVVILLIFASLWRSPTNVFGVLIGIALLAGGAWFATTLLTRLDTATTIAARSARLERTTAVLAQETDARTPLACLEVVASDALTSACERALFARPETAAAAAANVALKLDMLLEAGSQHERKDANYTATLAGLWRPLEEDRFGVVAYVLATRYGCTAERCEMLKDLPKSSPILNNMKNRVFEALLQRNMISATTAEQTPPPAAPSTASVAPPPPPEPAAPPTTAAIPAPPPPSPAPAAAPTAPRQHVPQRTVQQQRPAQPVPPRTNRTPPQPQ